MKIWTLKDFRIGSSKQTDFLAKALSDDVIEKNIEYTKWIIVPNYIKPYKIGINFDESDDLLNVNIEDYPDIIIFSGRRLAGLAIYLKKYFLKKANKKTKLISILNPNYCFKNFDFIILPIHDNIKYDKYKNIITIDGSLCNPKANIVDEKTEEFWKDSLKDYKEPFYSFMVGGNTKNKKFNLIKFAELIKNISKFINERNGTLLISTSRRTTDNYIKIIEKNINCKYYLYKWGKSNLLNPYYYFINNSKIIFLTGDSVSMISEISTIGKPIYIYKPEESLEKKHIIFCDSLLKKGIIREINLQTNNIEEFDTTPINELSYVVKKILTNINI